MRDYKGTSTNGMCLADQPVSNSNEPADSSAAGVGADHAVSGNWSGYVNRTTNATSISPHWTQQYAHACGCTGPTDQVTWVGLGGYTTNAALLQQAHASSRTLTVGRGTSTWTATGTARRSSQRASLTPAMTSTATFGTKAAAKSRTLRDRQRRCGCEQYAWECRNLFQRSTADYIDERPNACFGVVICISRCLSARMSRGRWHIRPALQECTTWGPGSAQLGNAQHRKFRDPELRKPNTVGIPRWPFRRVVYQSLVPGIVSPARKESNESEKSRGGGCSSGDHPSRGRGVHGSNADGRLHEQRRFRDEQGDSSDRARR